MNKGIIAVHVGAGSHSSSLKDDYKKVMRKACKGAILVIKSGGNAIDAAAYATKVLEDSELTNAAYGSSLTSAGSVECDAGLMDGSSLTHGACGAVSGIKNPIFLAKEILKSQGKIIPGGLIPPSFLVGPGAEEWAKDHQIERCDPDELRTEKAERIWLESIKYLERLKKEGKHIQPQLKNNMTTELFDTVGAVCVDNFGNVASSVSSGGLLLKSPGRVGQAAIYGSGCWAENNCEGSSLNVAVSTSGCGEHLVKTMFAHLCAKSSLSCDPLGADISHSVNDKFINSPFLRGVESCMGGSIILRHNPLGRSTDLFWLHTTQTMGIAYMDIDSGNVQTFFSEVPQERVGKTFTMGSKSFFSKTEMDEIDSLSDTPSQVIAP